MILTIFRLSKLQVEMVEMGVKYELCVGLTRGHKTSQNRNLRYTRDKKVKEFRPDRLSVQAQTNTENLCMILRVRWVHIFRMRSVACMELLKVSKDNRALKFLKHCLGTHIRGKRKCEELVQHSHSDAKSSSPCQVKLFQEKKYI